MIHLNNLLTFRKLARLIALATMLAFVVPARAQSPRIERVQVGLPTMTNAAGRTHVFKSGAWTPVYVDLVAGAGGLNQATLSVRAPDSDEVITSYKIELPAVAANANQRVLTYTRPGSLTPAIQVVLAGADGPVVSDGLHEAVQVYERVFLALGGNLPGLEKAIEEQLAQAAEGKPADAAGQTRGHVASINSVAELPDLWIGYDAADLMILNTGNADFVKQLTEPGQAARRDALSRWVRQGGRLVISVGKNAAAARELIGQLLPGAAIAIQPATVENLDTLPALENWVQVRGRAEPRQPVTLAQLTLVPGGDAEVLTATGDEHKLPLVMRMPFGLGQVTFVAFDLEQPLITKWPAQAAFWKKLQAELGASVLAKSVQANPVGPKRDPAFDLGGGLRDRLESFPTVSNISFGWVALFILIYILLIGPLDYLFLSKVLKRLEWTWITFPSVVLLVSVAVYFTAHWLKGSELLVNKIDLVDVDLAGQRAYGHSWFALYSPEISNYTLGITPKEQQGAERSLVTWMGRPDDRLGGVGRTRGQAMSQRDYAYAEQASGLIDVPIQVWTSKVFQADWDEAALPVHAELRAQPDGLLRGTITNRQAVPLEHAFLIYSGPDNSGRGKVYDLGKLDAGATRALELERQRAANLMDWMPLAGRDSDLPSLFKRICFHEIYPEDGRERNLSLRGLDQGWRIRLDRQAILFGWSAPVSGPGQDLNDSKQAPSRLWLGAVPAAGAARPPLPGSLTQQTFVRVFIPVRPANPQP